MLTSGHMAPAFQLPDLDGKEHSLEQLLADGPVLVALFKTSCPTCQLTFPYLDRLAKSKTLRVVGISQDDGSTTRAFNQKFGVHFPTLLDAKGYPASNAFGIEYVPTLFVVEPSGEISHAGHGWSKTEMQALGDRAGVQVFRPGDAAPEWKSG